MKSLASLLFVAMCFLFWTPVLGQEKTKLNLLLRHAIATEENAGKQLDLYLHGDQSKIKTFVEENNGVVKRCNVNRCAVRLGIEAIPILDELQFIERVGFNMNRGFFLNDTMRLVDSIVQIHAGQDPLPYPYQGENVLVGIIDAGVDPNHPDLQDAQGKTRILKIWDQRVTFDGNPWGYGGMYDSTDINAGLYLEPDEAAGGANIGHGTAVTGIAVGNGLANGNNIGAAPKSNVILVASDFTASNWTATVADAVDYIFSQADALGLPCVINASLGDYLGSHDGRDDPALDIDALLDAKRGRAMVCAAGNSGKQAEYHVNATVIPTDTVWTWFNPNPSSPFGANVVFIELWADTTDFKNVDFAIGADKTTPFYDFRGMTNFRDITTTMYTLFKDTIWNGSNRIATIQSWAEEINGVNMLQVFVKPDTTSYKYRFMATGTGEYDIWSAAWLGYNNMPASGLPSPAQLQDIDSYQYPDTFAQIVSSWACSDRVITVGSYQNTNAWWNYDTLLEINATRVKRARADASSRGPSRDGKVKPDICAAGHTVFCPTRLSELAFKIATEPQNTATGGWHYRQGGTSMASPQVAGGIALLLERCPLASATEIRDWINGNGYDDMYTWGSLPNVGWGNGKFDAFALLKDPTTFPITGDSAFCEGDSVLLTAPAAQSQYLWNTGATTQTIWADVAATYTVATVDGTGCHPAEPHITVVDPKVVGGLDSIVSICESETAYDLTLGRGGSATYGGAWTDDDVTGNLTDSILDGTNLGGSSYDFTYTVLGGTCPDSAATVTVNVSSVPNGGQDSSIALCETETSFNLAVAQAGWPEYGGTWNDDDLTGQLTDSILNCNGLGGGSYEYTYNVTGGACPDSAATITVVVTDFLNPGLDSNVFVCADQPAVNLNNERGGFGETGGTWTDDDLTGQLSVNLFDATGLGGGSYDFTYLQSPGGACTDTSSTLTVGVNNLPATPIITALGNTLTSSASTQYQWYLNGLAIGGGTAQSHTMVVNGNYHVIIADINGCSNSSDTTYHSPVGLVENQAGGIRIYPNPTRNSFYVTSSTSQDGLYLEVMDLNGKIIQVEQWQSIDAGASYMVSTSELQTGVYILRIVNAEETFNFKLVRQ